MTDTSEPTDAALQALADNHRLYEDYSELCTSVEYLCPVKFGRAVLAKWGSPAPAICDSAERCGSCDDTGHVHSLNGEWRGLCHCPAGAALQIQPVAVPVGMEPYAQHAIWNAVKPDDLVWTQYHDASDPMPKAWDAAPDVVVDLFTAAQVQAMLAKGLAPGWQAVPKHPTQDMLDNTAFFGTEDLGAVYRAMLAAAPSGAALEPLTDEQLVTCLQLAGFTTWDSRMWELKRQIEAALGITAAPKGGAQK